MTNGATAKSPGTTSNAEFFAPLRKDPSKLDKLDRRVLADLKPGFVRPAKAIKSKVRCVRQVPKTLGHKRPEWAPCPTFCLA